MCVEICNLVEVKVGRREPNVRLAVNPDRQRVPVRHQDPLADVKLATLHDQCVLNVLLSDVKLSILLVADGLRGVFVLDHVKDLAEVSLKTDASPTRAARRFENPDVTLTVQVKLRVLLSQQIQDFNCLCKLGVPLAQQFVSLLLLGRCLV